MGCFLKSHELVAIRKSATGMMVNIFLLRVNWDPPSTCSQNVRSLYLPWSSHTGVPFFQ